MTGLERTSSNFAYPKISPTRGPVTTYAYSNHGVHEMTMPIRAASASEPYLHNAKNAAIAQARGCPILCLLAKGGGRIFRAMTVTLAIPFDILSVPHPSGSPPRMGHSSNRPGHLPRVLTSEDTGRWRLRLGSGGGRVFRVMIVTLAIPAET